MDEVQKAIDEVQKQLSEQKIAEKELKEKRDASKTAAKEAEEVCLMKMNAIIYMSI